MSDSVERRFASLVQPHFAPLYRAALRLTRRRHDAEDLVQDVCLRACARLDELAAVDNPRAWLMRILYRLFIDSERRRRRAPVSFGADQSAYADSPSDGPGLERDADARRMHERLAAVWDELESEQRALLALHAEGSDFAELAEAFGINRNAVSARLHRARLRLAKLLAAEESKPSLKLVGTKS
jgi:RNA polymerase sigma-70 factor (ECF subfamily)